MNNIFIAIKRWFAPRDMSVGKPWQRIVEFAIPMIIGNMAQQLYSTVDSIVVGKYVGDNALAAVGSASPILNLMLALFIGVSTGVSILVAQCFGAKDYKRLSHTIGNCITLMSIISLATMAVTPFITRPMLELLDTPASILDWSADYLFIFLMGIGGHAFYNTFPAFCAGWGTTCLPLVFC